MSLLASEHLVRRSSSRHRAPIQGGTGAGVVAVLAAVLAASACSSGSSSDAADASARVPTPSPTPAVTVDQPGYRFTLPAGLRFQAPRGAWQEGPGNWPDIDTAGFAAVFAPDLSSAIALGRRPTARGADLDSWISAMTRSRTIVYPDVMCRPPVSTSTRLDSERAQVRVLLCPGVGPGAGIRLILAVHRGYGYAATCANLEAADSASFTEQCLEWLSTFRFAG